MAYKVKIQKDYKRPYTARKTFETIEEADEYAHQIDCDYELIYEIFDEDGNSVSGGAIFDW